MKPILGLVSFFFFFLQKAAVALPTTLLTDTEGFVVERKKFQHPLFDAVFLKNLILFPYLI